MNPDRPSTSPTPPPSDQNETPRPSSRLLRRLKERLNQMNSGPDEPGEIWLVDDTTGELIDRATVQKKDNQTNPEG